MKSYIENWINKCFPNVSDNAKHKLFRILSKGANYMCAEPCSASWKAKKGEVFEKCPKCGSHRIGIITRKQAKNASGEFISLYS